MFRYKQERARAREEAAKSGNGSSSSGNVSPSSSGSISSSSIPLTTPPFTPFSSSSCKNENVFKTTSQFNNYKKTIFSRDPFAYMKAKPNTKIDLYDIDNKQYTSQDNRYSLSTANSNSRIYTNGKEMGFASTSFNRTLTNCQKCNCTVTSEVARRTTYSYKSDSVSKFQPAKGDYRYSKHTCNH